MSKDYYPLGKYFAFSVGIILGRGFLGTIFLNIMPLFMYKFTTTIMTVMFIVGLFTGDVLESKTQTQKNVKIIFGMISALVLVYAQILAFQM